MTSLITAMINRASLSHFAWLSIAASILTIGLKAVAYLLTDSVGLLSDVLESFVNLAGGIMALAMLTIAARPADEDHHYGHSKAEYFSSSVEGTLIVFAAIGIGIAAVQRFISPRPLTQIGLGLGVSVVAALINLGAATVLLKAGRRHNSITLEANAHHLLTDVWTSAGVVVGIGAVAVTNWQRLDPLVALIVAVNIVWSGYRIIRNSITGLMDGALPLKELKTIQEVLKRHLLGGVACHALRTRQSGARRFVSLHVLVPGDWTVQNGHQFVERIETDLRQAVPNIIVFTHLESLNDPASWSDTALDRAETTMRNTDTKHPSADPERHP